MYTFTTDGIVVENIILYNFVYDLFSLFYLLIVMLFNPDVTGIVFICFILFHFISFISTYHDVIGNYVLRSCDVIASYVWQME